MVSEHTPARFPHIGLNIQSDLSQTSPPFFPSALHSFTPPSLSLLLVSVAQQRPWALWSEHPFWAPRLSSTLLVNEQTNLLLSVCPLPLIHFSLPLPSILCLFCPLSLFFTPALFSIACTCKAVRDCYLKGQQALCCKTDRWGPGLWKPLCRYFVRTLFLIPSTL